MSSLTDTTIGLIGLGIGLAIVDKAIDNNNRKYKKKKKKEEETFKW